jgi:prepilin-type N-terminal cleavage/methylation domain-containing protein
MDLRRFRPHTDQAGQTLVELMVSMAILGVVLAIFLGVLAWVQTALTRETTRSTTEDQIRLAMEAIDRDVRTATVLYDPAVETPTAYFGLRVAHRNTNSTTIQCIQYRVENQVLERRTWTSGNLGSVSAWRTMAENVVNSTSSAADRPFQLETTAAAGYGSTLGSRIVDVTFVVNAKSGSSTSNDVRLTSSMSIRNQTSGDPCTPVPSG